MQVRAISPTVAISTRPHPVSTPRPERHSFWAGATFCRDRWHTACSRCGDGPTVVPRWSGEYWGRGKPRCWPPWRSSNCNRSRSCAVPRADTDRTELRHSSATVDQSVSDGVMSKFTKINFPKVSQRIRKTSTAEIDPENPPGLGSPSTHRQVMAQPWYLQVSRRRFPRGSVITGAPRWEHTL